MPLSALPLQRLAPLGELPSEEEPVLRAQLAALLVLVLVMVMAVRALAPATAGVALLLLTTLRDLVLSLVALALVVLAVD